MDQETRPSEDRFAQGDHNKSNPRRAVLALSAAATIAGIAALASLSTLAEGPPAASPDIAPSQAQVQVQAQAVAHVQPEAEVHAPIAPSAPAESEAAAEVAPPTSEPASFGSADQPPPLRIMTFAACFEASACEEQTIPSTTVALTPNAQALWQGPPLERDEAGAGAQTLVAEAAPAEAPAPAAESLAANTAPVMRTVPLPVRRPLEFRQEARQALAREMVRREARPVAVPLRNAAMPEAPIDNRSAFEKLFGVPQQPVAPAMAYAALDPNPTAVAPTPTRRALAPAPAPAPVAVTPMVTPRASGGTAVYDISARTVTLPSGERLEAHSGIGDVIDDPRYVHVRMKGPTPPGTYDLTWREQSFHGVQALRMTPVGGSAAIHGRTGILAHHYLRGPSGESNGCVSIKNYERLRQAYQRGEVNRLVVVTGGSSNGISNFVSRLFGGS